jgi:hypothetical protein
MVVMVTACEGASSSSSSAAAGFDAGSVSPDPGAQNDAPPSADTGSGSEEGGADGGVDADVPPLIPDYFVDPALGADTNDGKTKATAFKTLCKAKDVAQADQVVGLLDGSYDNENQRPANWIFSYPCGPTFSVPIRLTAVNAGKALVKVPITLTGGEVRGLKLEYDANSGGTLGTNAGTLVIRDLSLGEIFSPPNAKRPALSVSGTAKVTMFSGAVTNYTTVPVPAGQALIFALVTGTGELTVEGGTFDDTSPANADGYCSPLFEGGGKITLNGVTVRHKGTIVRVYNVLNVTGGTLDDRATAFNIGCLPTIGLLNGVAVTVKDTVFVGGGRNAITSEVFTAGTLTLTNVTMSGFTDAAVDLNAPDVQPLAFFMRGSSVKNNNVGLRLFGGVAADLGTAQSVGNNTITGNTTRGLDNTASLTVKAAGNTWIANEQGARADGTYAASLETGPTSGLNYALGTAAQTIQF